MERKISEKVVFNGRLLKVVLRKVVVNGERESERELVFHPGAVGIIPVKGESVILVKQFRSPIEEELVEIPAGKLKKGEDPEECAKRELLEETGFEGNLKKIGSFISSPGFTNEVIHIFLARDIKFKTKEFMRPGEIDKVIEVSLKEAFEMLEKGKIKDLKTAFALSYLKANYGSL